jgi:hypothetical protein
VKPGISRFLKTFSLCYLLKLYYQTEFQDKADHITAILHYKAMNDMRQGVYGYIRSGPCPLYFKT